MDSFELSKIAGAVLCALLVVFGTRTAIEIAGAPHGPAISGYKLPEPEPAVADAGGGAAAPAAFDVAAVTAAVDKADAGAGQAVFKKCGSCHTPDEGGANAVGPNLWAVVGRKIASKEGFDYSPALKGKEGNWSAEELAKFIHNPKAFASGTKMVFAGIADAGQLADLIAYLKSLGGGAAAAEARK